MNKTKRVLSVALAALIMLSMAAVIVIADGEICNVVINYVYADGTKAAPSWTARVTKGSNINQSVTSPTVVGYTPDKLTVSLNEANIQENKTVTVIYSPALVNFTVRHYQQNVDSDKYTLFDTENKKGYTESEVEVGGKLAKEYDGFTALLYDTTTKIAADGSTVVEIYYDRNYYMLSLNLDGGYGAEPVYARYGAKVEISNPTKPGYTFAGWDPALPATVPAENKTYTAQWTADASAKVTVVFWGENPNDEQYSYYKSFETTATPGETFTLPADGTVICGKTEHTHSAACRYACGITEHRNHTTACYAGVGSSSSSGAGTGAPSNPADGYVYRKAYTASDKVIYINGTWYNYSGSASVGSTASATCGKQLHTHTASCGYACGQTEHKHNDACRYSSGMDSNLWKFVRSDEVTVAADGSTIVNVYYDRVEFTLHFRQKNSSSDDYGTITAKWGANIADEFNSVTEKAGSSFWTTNRNGSQPYTNYIPTMPDKDTTYYNSGASGREGSMYYWGESLDDATIYDVKLHQVDGVGGYIVSDEDRYDFDGFTYDHGTENDVSCKNAAFYYKRNSYKLVFYNYGELVKTEDVKFEAPLSKYNFIPSYPTNLEANAYEFKGWYTTEECFEGSEMNWSSTMPAASVTVYAKWAPKTHTVKTWLTDAMDKPAYDDGDNTWTVPHRSTIDKPANPTNGNYTFVGWFYKENGVEKAFDFSMAVTKDLNLYAKWSSNTLVGYTIKYTLEDGTVIAEETAGSALAGTTKTFEAKTGDELNEGYKTGYYPKTASHSIDMKAEGSNEYTFVYVPKAEVGYKVRYLEKDTNKELREEKKNTTTHNIITEQFVAIEGYAPDAYSKRLVLSADEKENVITFWYTKDEIHAPVQVIHWTQNIEGDGYTEYQTSTDVNGVIGQTYTEAPLNIPGFTYNTENSNASGTLTANGLVLNLYYDRIEYPYEFRFVDESGETIADTVSGKARYQAQVTCTADEKIANGYKLKSTETNPKAIVIEIEDSETIAKKNVKTFVYETYFTVVHVQGNSSIPEEVTIIQSIKDNGYCLTNAVTPSYLYGGAFSDKACKTVQTFEQGENAINFTPVKGETYYIWEVSQNYLKPRAYVVSRHDPAYNGQWNVVGLYLTSSVDRDMYQLVGFEMGSDADYATQNVYTKVRAVYTDTGEVKEEMYVKPDGDWDVQTTAPTSTGGYVSMYKVDMSSMSTNSTITYRPYWVTLDGIKVTGAYSARTCTYRGPGEDKNIYDDIGITQLASAVSDVSIYSKASTQTVAVESVGVLNAAPETAEEPATPDVPETPVVPEVPEAPAMTLTGEAMFLRAQYTYEMMTNTVKFISAIDVNACTEYGFVINGETIRCEEAAETVDGYSAAYLFGESVNGAMLMSCNVLLDGFADGMTINITPYCIDLNGNVVYGETRTLVYRQWMGLEG